MAFYMEEEVWKCPKHPSKRRRSGICPNCLRDRLLTLCVYCANVRPCACCVATSSSSTSSSSSSFSILSSGTGAVDRVSNLIDGEPAFHRSRSVAIPFFRSRFAGDGKTFPVDSRSRSSFWSSVFRTSKREKGGEERDGEELKRNINVVDDEFERTRTRMMMRSRSVSVQVTSNTGAVKLPPAGKGRGWHFPSPIKVFRQSKMCNVVQERSPLYRG
ncbi:hypothetical protein LguiA_015338 [Lonicera macranthoides]